MDSSSNIPSLLILFASPGIRFPASLQTMALPLLTFAGFSDEKHTDEFFSADNIYQFAHGTISEKQYREPQLNNPKIGPDDFLKQIPADFPDPLSITLEEMGKNGMLCSIWRLAYDRIVTE